MPGEHVFVDESKRSGYVVAAALVPADSIRAVEAGLRELLLPGQRSVHFKRESEGRRRTLLAGMAQGDRAADERVLAQMRQKTGGTFLFHHEQPHRRPGLWIADAVAWSWAHGGRWRQLAGPLTADARIV